MNSQTEGERLRDEGHAKVIKHDLTWHNRAMGLLLYIPSGREHTGEEMRTILHFHIGEPAHPNAWGALIRAAAKKGIIEDTGRCVKASNASAHARRLPVWRFK